MTTKKAKSVAENGASALAAAVTGERYREHDLLVRRYHLAGLVPSEIAVVLNSQGIRVKTWAVTETFVRARLEAMDLAAHHSRTVLQQSTGAYRLRPRLRGQRD